MTKKEYQLIKKKIDQYDQWAAEELKAYENAEYPEEEDDCWLQYRINGASADCLRLLLDELEYMAKRAKPYAVDNNS